MFLIKKIGFDNMENYNPKHEDIIGVIDCTEEEEAERWIKTHNPSCDKQYKGWDGNYYPYYTKTPIDLISLDDNSIPKKKNVKVPIRIDLTKDYTSDKIVYKNDDGGI